MQRSIKNTAIRNRGTALFVTLVLLVLFSLLIVSLFSTSQVNLRITTNAQATAEVNAASQQAIEEVISRNFMANPQPVTKCIDTTGDNTCDYTVQVEKPTCLNSVPVLLSELDPVASADDYACTVSLSEDASGLDPLPAIGASYCTNSQWDINAKVTDTALWGVSTSVHQGVGKRVPISTTC